MWGKQVVAKESAFYKGKSIFETLTKSLFGKFRDIISALIIGNPVELEQYKLPIAIVIGNESTGKSSLLENITKCQLFRRHNLLCTRAPIHLILNNGPPKYIVKYNNIQHDITDKKDIYTKVNEILDSISADSISENEIIIEMTDYELPCFEFFDLPGIRSYPPKMAEITTNLCKKYLSNRDSIVLCVVPSTVTSLTSCQSIALITEMKMEHNCILALTMADRLQPQNVENLLVKRILQTSDEIVNLQFAGCIAVVNRLHTDEYSLEENDDLETKWFNDNIIQYIPTEYSEQKRNIEANVTISNLLQKMDLLYNKFIHSDWKPRIIGRITTDITNIQTEINLLGIEIINFCVVSQLFKTFIDTDLIPLFIPLTVSDNITGRIHTTTAQYTEYYASLSMVDKLSDEYFGDGIVVAKILDYIDNFFIKNNKTDPNLKLYKFEGIYNDIDTGILSKHEHLIINYKDNIINATINYLNYLYNDQIEFSPEIIKIKFIEMYNLLIIHRLLTNFYLENNSTDNIYNENIEYSTKRCSLIKRLQIIENYRKCVNDFKNE